MIREEKKVVILNNRYTSRVIATQFVLLRKGISYLLEKRNKVCLHLEEVATQFVLLRKGISYLLEKRNKVCLHLEEVATQFMFMNKTN